MSISIWKNGQTASWVRINQGILQANDEIWCLNDLERYTTTFSWKKLAEGWPEDPAVQISMMQQRTSQLPLLNPPYPEAQQRGPTCPSRARSSRSCPGSSQRSITYLVCISIISAHHGVPNRCLRFAFLLIFTYSTLALFSSFIPAVFCSTVRFLGKMACNFSTSLIISILNWKPRLSQTPNSQSISWEDFFYFDFSYHLS